MLLLFLIYPLFFEFSHLSISAVNVLLKFVRRQNTVAAPYIEDTESFERVLAAKSFLLTLYESCLGARVWGHQGVLSMTICCFEKLVSLEPIEEEKFRETVAKSIRT